MVKSLTHVGVSMHIDWDSIFEECLFITFLRCLEIDEMKSEPNTLKRRLTPNRLFAYCNVGYTM